jgi:hypothetical protein
MIPGSPGNEKTKNSGFVIWQIRWPIVSLSVPVFQYVATHMLKWRDGRSGFNRERTFQDRMWTNPATVTDHDGTADMSEWLDDGISTDANLRIDKRLFGNDDRGPIHHPA